jgi:hypothetical protein
MVTRCGLSSCFSQRVTHHDIFISPFFIPFSTPRWNGRGCRPWPVDGGGQHPNPISQRGNMTRIEALSTSLIDREMSTRPSLSTGRRGSIESPKGNTKGSITKMHVNRGYPLTETMTRGVERNVGETAHWPLKVRSKAAHSFYLHTSHSGASN